MKQAAGNSKRIWQIVNEVISQSSKQSILPDNLTESTVEKFNTYFTNIGPSLAEMLPDHTLPTYSVTPIVNSFVMHDIDMEEILITVNNLSTAKAAGPDGITVRLVKENIDILGPVLLRLFNHSLHTGNYPSTLKTAKVTPIFKEGDKSDPSNYRPISVLSVINTIFEKILAKRIHPFFLNITYSVHNNMAFDLIILRLPQYFH